MKFVCSQGHEVKWNAKTCSQCNEGLRVRDFLKREWKLIKRGPLVYCTWSECARAHPITYEECPFCGRKNTVENAFKSVTDPVSYAIQESKPQTRRKFQRLYLILSAIALFALFRHMTTLDTETWIRMGIVSIVYLGSLALLIKWFVRPEIVIKFLLLTSWVVKLAMIFNYLVCLMLLQLAVVQWWVQFMALAALVAISYGGAWVFCWLFWPMTGNIKTIFLGEQVTNIFDSMQNQGRSGRRERDGGTGR